MPRFMKHLAAAVLLAGGVLLAGTSFVGAHSPDTYQNSSCRYLDHEHTQPSEGACEYGCILKGHNHHEYDEDEEFEDEETQIALADAEPG